MNILAYTLISGVMGVVGQLILKQAMLSTGPMALRLDTALFVARTVVLNPMVILGLIITVSGTFFWLIAISRADLSYAYPLTSLNYLLVMLASWLVFGERPSPMRVLGVAAICLGVWAISRTPARTVFVEKHLTPTSARPVGCDDSERHAERSEPSLGN